MKTPKQVLEDYLGMVLISDRLTEQNVTRIIEGIELISKAEFEAGQNSKTYKVDTTSYDTKSTK